VFRRRAAVAASIVGIAGCLWAVVAPPAAAEFTENTVGCAGSAVIESSDGTFNVSAEDSVAEVPRDGTANWEGSLTTATHNHSGQITLRLGPVGIELGDWSSENEDDETSANGVEELPSELSLAPPGRYRVEGFHEGDEGRCAGHVDVEVAGNPLTTPVGAAAAFGTLATGALLGLAAKAKVAR
jgi:hypothetical protein